MQTTVSHSKAVELFFRAAAYWADEETKKQNEANTLHKQEEQKLKAIPWYKRWLYPVDAFTGFKEDVKAIRYGEYKLYCYRQLEILNSLSRLSTVQLTQRDLNILNIGE